jgi:hypothetical protein
LPEHELEPTNGEKTQGTAEIKRTCLSSIFGLKAHASRASGPRQIERHGIGTQESTENQAGGSEYQAKISSGTVWLDDESGFL